MSECPVCGLLITSTGYCRQCSCWGYSKATRGKSVSGASHAHTSDLVKRRRVGLGLTLAEVARRAGISPSLLKMIEGQKRKPSALVILRLAEALGEDPGLYLRSCGFGVKTGWVSNEDLDYIARYVERIIRNRILYSEKSKTDNKNILNEENLADELDRQRREIGGAADDASKNPRKNLVRSKENVSTRKGFGRAGRRSASLGHGD